MRENVFCFSPLADIHLPLCDLRKEPFADMRPDDNAPSGRADQGAISDLKVNIRGSPIRW